MSRNIQITIVAIIASMMIVVIGYYFIPFEQQKMSYLPLEVIERMNSEGSVGAFSCERSYPDLCIPKESNLTCDNILEKSFTVKHDDPNNLDPDGNGIGCEP